MKEYPYVGGVQNRLCLSEESVNFPLKQLWKSGVGKGKFIRNPVIGRGKIFVSLTVPKEIMSSSVLSLNMNDGKLHWEVIPEKIKFLQENICLYQDRLLSSIGDALVCLNADTGAVLWQQEHEILKGGARFSGDGIMLHRDKVLVNGWDGIASIDPKSGTAFWINEIKGVTIPSVFDDKIVFGDGTKGNIYCLHADTGELIWKKSVAKIGEYYDEIESRSKGKDIIVPGKLTSRFPLISDGKIFGSLGRYMCCFDLETGDLIWKSEGGGTPIFKEGKIYSFKSVYLFCYSSETGDAIYKKRYVEEGSFSSSLPFISGNSFFVGTETGLYVFDIKTGEKVWEFHSRRKRAGFLSQPIFIDGRLYAGCEDGYMYCFESKKG